MGAASFTMARNPPRERALCFASTHCSGQRERESERESERERERVSERARE